MDRFRDYLFAEHNESILIRWANGLSFFRFCRAYGGHCNDGDHFLAVLRYLDEIELLTIFKALKLSPNRLGPVECDPKTGQPLPDGIYENFKFRIKDLPHLEQIGWCEIDGCRCHAWASLGQLRLSVSGADGDSYRVSETDFENAKIIETRLHELREYIVDPPQDDRNCICPKHYGGYFSTIE